MFGTRQLLIVSLNELKVVCYEASKQKNALPQETEFSFEKVSLHLQELQREDGRATRKLQALQRRALLTR